MVAAYVSSLRAGDSVAAKRGLDALLTRPIAIEFEPSGNNDGGTVVELSDGLLAEELSASGPRLFLVPDSSQGEIGRALARVEEVDYSDGGLGSRVWDASVAAPIRTIFGSKRVVSCIAYSGLSKRLGAFFVKRFHNPKQML